MKLIAANKENHLKVCCVHNTYEYRLSDIIRMEASSNYTRIYTLHRRPLVVAKVLAAYAAVLEGAGFVRVHQSHLVNPAYIRFVHPSGAITLADESQVTISRRRKKAVAAALRHSGLVAPCPTGIG